MSDAMISTLLQPELLFFLALSAVLLLASHFFGGESDSTRGLVFRALFCALIFLHGSLFSLVSWRFSPRAQTTGIIQNIDFNAGVSDPVRVTLCCDNGKQVRLKVPWSAAQAVQSGEAVEVTYTTWSRRVVAMRDLQHDEDIPVGAAPFDLKVLAQSYAVGVVVFGAGLLCFAWIRRRNRARATVDLAEGGRG
jgi:hypothetical protein